MFEAASTGEFIGPIRTRCATPYFDPEFWRPGWISIGEKALALDPLSSTGVEKSMRLALQAVIAANTVLDDPASAAVAREFYETRLLESATMHTRWTRGYYASAWPGVEYAFWRDRSSGVVSQGSRHAGLFDRFQQISKDSSPYSGNLAGSPNRTIDQAGSRSVSPKRALRRPSACRRIHASSPCPVRLTTTLSFATR